MRMYDIIQKKRDHKELSEEEIRFFINEYTAGNIPDYQASALMMAVYLNSMTDREIVWLTEAMTESGDRVDLSMFGHLSVDKHSTGGVGDKTSLIVAPIVASLGGKVAKMSGRGLGHTGGTIDKLESIPGYRTSLSSHEFIRQVDRIGLALIGQSGNMTPADKKLYALRDVTATVDSIPLITSSVMSKKIAAGAQSIVLDVKTGSGAFMKTLSDAEALASEMVRIGKKCNRRIAALITNMNAPLGCAVGNSLEIAESVDILKNNTAGPLTEICVALATAMVSLVHDISDSEAEQRVRTAISSGAAFNKMLEWIDAQGGDVKYIENPELLAQSGICVELKADRGGYIIAVDAEKVGTCAMILGAGRKSKTDSIDHSAGIIIKKNIGDRIEPGDTLCVLHTNDSGAVEIAREKYLSAITLSDTPPTPQPLIYKTVR